MIDPIDDIAIIGGGINGSGIARDAAGRGYRVYLCEQDDLAIGTSSRATKLIHGGLRYLEHFEFRLVREALLEREILWRMAPHIIWPLRFVLPYHKGLRPAWMLRLGLFLYDHLGGRRLLPPTRALDLTKDPAGQPLQAGFRLGFEYSDCWVDDARLVLLNALAAREFGAQIETRTALIEARRNGDHWVLTLERRRDGQRIERRARILVNAAGPWVGEILGRHIRTESAPRLRMVQGSHIIVRRLFDHDRCYIFQNADGRIVFAIPYERHFTLIGTTDRDFSGDPGEVAASGEEMDYLCAIANAHFRKEIGRADIVWHYSGVRPLYDDGASSAQAATRDYVLALDGKAGEAPLLNIFGGKITTYRRLAEAALDRLQAYLPTATAPTGRTKGWTGKEPLPGGDFPVTGVEERIADLRARYPFIAPDHAARLLRLYGTRADRVLGGAKRLADLGRAFGGDLYEAEVAYLMREEWAESAADILWRRSKLGLILSAEESAALDAWMILHPALPGEPSAVAKRGSAL